MEDLGEKQGARAEELHSDLEVNEDNAEAVKGGADVKADTNIEKTKHENLKGITSNLR